MIDLACSCYRLVARNVMSLSRRGLGREITPYTSEQKDKVAGLSNSDTWRSFLRRIVENFAAITKSRGVLASIVTVGRTPKIKFQIVRELLHNEARVKQLSSRYSPHHDLEFDSFRATISNRVFCVSGQVAMAMVAEARTYFSYPKY